MTKCYAILVTLLLAACGNTEGPAVEGLGAMAEDAIATAHTTRLPGSDPESQAIMLTQAVYPATREENAPGAIILTPPDVAEAFTTMHRVTHMPVNAPLLYLTRDGQISERTWREMKRLRPDGVVQDGKTQVYLSGNVDPALADEIKKRLDYKTKVFRATNPATLAELLDRWQAALKSDHPDEVVISALDHPDGVAHGMGAMGWNAHMGKGFAWVYRDSVPEATHKILKRRFGDREVYMYLTGGPNIISDSVARELSQYGLVRRIAGPNVFATNTVNAGYKDFGRDFGWWWGWEPRNFGWGIAQSGHNYIIASVDDLLGAIPAVLLGHMGKHGPLLLIQPDGVPKPVVDYLKMVKPHPSGPSQTILNHAWIIGDTETISWNAQRQIESLLRPTTPEDTGESALSADQAMNKGK